MHSEPTSLASLALFWHKLSGAQALVGLGADLPLLFNERAVRNVNCCSVTLFGRSRKTWRTFTGCVPD